jgi:hypothetical protein
MFFLKGSRDFNYKNTSPSPLLNFFLLPNYSFVFPCFNSFDFLHSYFFFYPPPVDFSIFFSLSVSYCSLLVFSFESHNLNLLSLYWVQLYLEKNT